MGPEPYGLVITTSTEHLIYNICYMLYVICYMLYGISYMLYGICYASQFYKVPSSVFAPSSSSLGYVISNESL
jgi:hypothetical protein